MASRFSLNFFFIFFLLHYHNKNQLSLAMGNHRKCFSVEVFFVQKIEKLCSEPLKGFSMYGKNVFLAHSFPIPKAWRMGAPLLANEVIILLSNSRVNENKTKAGKVL